MLSFEVVSDSACDLTLEDYKKHNVVGVPFYVSPDGAEYKKEQLEITHDEFYSKLLENKSLYPKTSLPSVQDYVDVFTKATNEKKGVVCLTITSSLSGSYQSALSAKQIVDEQFPDADIYVCNTFQATVCQRLMVFQTCRCRDKGMTAADTYAFLEHQKINARIFFYVGDIAYLEKGGRIGKLSFLAGSILKIVPLIILEDGSIRSAGICRSKTKAIEKVVQLTKEFFIEKNQTIDDYEIITGFTTTKDDAEKTVNHLHNVFGDIEIPICQIGATIGAHTGPGTIGIAIVEKMENFIK